MSTWKVNCVLCHFTGSLKCSVTAPSEINERAELELLGVQQNSRQKCILNYPWNNPEIYTLALMAIKWRRWPTYITHNLSKHQALPSLAHIQIHKPLAEVGADVQCCASLSETNEMMIASTSFQCTFLTRFWRYVPPFMSHHKSWQSCW